MNNKGINLQFSMVLKGKGDKMNAPRITYSCEDYAFNWTFAPHTHMAKITVFVRRLCFRLTIIIFLTTLKKERVVMHRGFNVSACKLSC